MRVAVTGLDGFIARYTILELQKRGHKVVGLMRHTSNNPILKDVDIYLADIRDSAGVYGMIEHVDGVIHLAGLLGTTENIRQAELLNETNIGGALNVLNACDNFKTPLVNIAVGNWYENNPYSISKTTAERYCLMYAKYFGTPANVVRTLNAVGPYQKWGKVHKIVPTFINHALRNEPINVYGGRDHCSVMDLVYAGDVAKVLCDVLLNEKTYGNIFEAGTGKGYKVWDIAQDIVRVCKSKSELIEVPMRAGESEESVVVANKPYPIEYRDIWEVISETVDYYRGCLESS